MTEQQGALYQFFQPGDKVPGKSSRDYSGRGYAIYGNGDQYDGQYLNGIREGKGKYLYINGDKYEGEFKNNKKHGIGRLSYKDKGQYYGQWEHGHKHGEGTYQYPNGDTYAGTWKFGQKCGAGTYTYTGTGYKLIGQFKDNKIVAGKWVFPNGSFYAGEFKDNKPNGAGEWNLNSGNVLKGEYRQAVLPNEDPDDPRVNVKLDWQSGVGLATAAEQVNKHEIF